MAGSCELRPRLKTEGTATCPRCGTATPDGVLSGHCPQCLITTALDGFLLDASPGPEPATIFGSFGDYELLDEIARGGMGVVYRARQKSLNRLVAVKMLLGGEFASPEFVRRFQAEAEAAARLQHPNIVRIHEVGQEKGQHFFSMELIEGSDLAHLVRERPLPPRRAAEYLKGIAEAVHFAHGQGILHRDLKPSNILIDPFDQPRITDFGLARQFEAGRDITVTKQAFGSPAYISPEQARGDTAGPAADIYSLGALLYHLVTGRPPFQSETIHGILRQVSEREPLPPRALNPGVPPDLQTICLKCLEKIPSRRYASAADLALELGRFLRDEPILARPAGRIEKVWRWSRRRPVVAALSTALLIATIGGVTGIFSQWRRATASERKMGLNLYAADMRQAANALAEGDLGQARRLLNLHQPKEHAPDLRGFEWYYLWHRCLGEQAAVLSGHEGIVTTVATSPDGRWAVSGGQDGLVFVWDIEQKRLVTQFNSPGKAVWDVQFTSDGRHLVAAGWHGSVQLWNTKNWTQAGHFPGLLASTAREWIATADSSPFPWPQEPAGPAQLWNLKRELVWESPGPARRLALSNDGTLLALVPAHQPEQIQIWAVPKGPLQRTLTREKPVWSVAFSPSGEHLLACGWNRNFTRYDLRNGESRTVTNGHDLTIWSAKFSTDGQKIVTASSDRTLALWEADSLRQLRRMRGHENEVWSAAFGRDERSIVTGGKDEKVLLWGGAQDVRENALVNGAYVRPLFSPDGGLLMTRLANSNDWLTKVYDANTRALISDQPGYALGFAADSSRVVWFDEGQRTLRFTATTNNNEVGTIRLELTETEFPISQVSRNGRWFFAIDRYGEAGIWKTTGERVASFPVLKPPIRTASLSRNGEWLAISVEREYDVHVYRVPDGKVTRLKGHHDHVTGIDFSPDSESIATGSVDADVRIFETGTGNLRFQLSGHLEEATDVAFSPDGKTLASLGTQSALKLWHVATGREVASLPMPHASAYLSFSPGGMELAISRHDDRLEMLEAPRGPKSDARGR